MTQEPDIVERLLKRASMVTPWATCCGEAAAEIERLRKDNLHWEHQNGLLEDKVERLRAALQRIDGINDNPAYFRFNPMIEEVLRAALEPKP